MSEAEFIQDVVLLFAADGSSVEMAMRMPEFERWRLGTSERSVAAGYQVRAAYVTVAPGLKIDGVVFFTLTRGRDGRFTTGFEVALSYLVAQAGIRTDLGLGRVRVASRGHCPVPWVASKLWEPERGEGGVGQLIQRAILLNRVGLSSSPGAAAFERRSEPVSLSAEPVEARDHEAPVETDEMITAAPPVSVPAPAGRASSSVDSAGLREQLRRYRAEVLELKAALRHERELNRRLQALVRGEP